MRLPLILLICAYAISILGFVLIPGLDDNGNVWYMGFFHAFYFVSFMGSTIGFGEIPYPFTDAQRIWTTFTVYITVFTWLYGIGSLLAVIQNTSFQRVVRESRFRRNVSKITSQFYLICGYGDTGSILVKALAERGIRSVVIDIKQSCIDSLEILDLPIYIPGLVADASNSDALIAAGLQNPRCAGVVALTDNDHVNLKVGIISKLLQPTMKVICRADTHDAEANMDSFGTDHIINPFDTFAKRLAMAIHSPSMYLIYEWMTSTSTADLREPVTPPRGTWVICGFGRFGKAVVQTLTYEGIKTVVIEAKPEITGIPENSVIGRGTEAITLREANIQDAVGIIAGTDDDANNLSIIITARDLNKDLFSVARQNEQQDDLIYSTANIDLLMKRSSIIARKILAIINTPLLSEFLHMVRHQNYEWCNILVSKLSGIIGNRPPDTWTISITKEKYPLIVELLDSDESMSVADMYKDPRDHIQKLDCLPLLLKRGDECILLPSDTLSLRKDDQILFTGRTSAQLNMIRTICNYNLLHYVNKGVEPSTSYIWSKLTDR